MVYLPCSKQSFHDQQAILSLLSRSIGIGKHWQTPGVLNSDYSIQVGGINVILCGNFHQFPPVTASVAPMYVLYHPKT